MNNVQKPRRHNPFSLVEKLPESRENIKPFAAESKSNSKDCKERTYRIEVKSSDGKSLHYGLKATNRDTARQLAVKFVSDMAFSFQDERLAWRLAGDNNWQFNGSVKEKKSLLRKIGEYFFILDEEEQIREAK